MKNNIVSTSALVILLCCTAFSSANTVAAEKPFGEPGSAADSVRTIDVGPSTDWLEVKRGEIVKFNVAGKEFFWNFDVQDTRSKFDMDKIAPAGLLDHKVVIYMDGRPRDFAKSW